jgi:hypothetical protein
MATAFDGVGMSQLGKESQYYGGTNPFREAMKGLKDFAIISGIQKSGLQDFLNTMGKKEGQGVPPPNALAAPVIPNAPPAVPVETPAPQVTAPVIQEVMPIEKQAENAFGLQSLLTPDPLKPRDSGMDQVAMQMAFAPPPQLNLPKYGKQPGGGGGGIDPATILSIAKFFI